MNPIKFSGTFTFKNLDAFDRQRVEHIVQNQLDEPTPYQPTSLYWQKSEDTLEIQVYNRAKIFGHCPIQETLPTLDKKIKAQLDATKYQPICEDGPVIEIPYTYTAKLGTEPNPHRSRMQKIFGS